MERKNKGGLISFLALLFGSALLVGAVALNESSNFTDFNESQIMPDAPLVSDSAVLEEVQEILE